MTGSRQLGVDPLAVTVERYEGADGDGFVHGVPNEEGEIEVIRPAIKEGPDPGIHKI
jgi:hypothetical protein